MCASGKCPLSISRTRLPNVANGTLLRNDRDQRDDVQRASDIDGRLAGLRVEIQVVQT